MSQVVLQMIGLLVFMLLIPLGMGLLVMQAYPMEERKPGMTLLAGYLSSFAAFELVTMPIVLFVKGQNFVKVEIFFTLLSALLALAGYVLAIGRRIIQKEFYMKREGMFPGSKAAWALVVFVLLYMLYMSVTHMSFDGDDSYYVVQSLITQQTGTMYTVSPYVGGATAMDMRHAMAVFTMWVAYMGSMCGIHTTIFCHTVLPCVIIPLALCVELQIGRVLLHDKEDMLPFFAFFAELLLIFGYVSMYTSETFLMTRTWQGKALAAAFLIPMVLWQLLQLSVNPKNKGVWVMLVLISIASGLFSSLAVLLCVMLTAVSGFFLMLREKSFWLYVKLGCTCIPAVLYMGLYLAIGHLF